MQHSHPNKTEKEISNRPPRPSPTPKPKPQEMVSTKILPTPTQPLKATHPLVTTPLPLGTTPLLQASTHPCLTPLTANSPVSILLKTVCTAITLDHNTEYILCIYLFFSFAIFCFFFELTNYISYKLHIATNTCNVSVSALWQDFVAFNWTCGFPIKLNKSKNFGIIQNVRYYRYNVFSHTICT